MFEIIQKFQRVILRNRKTFIDLFTDNLLRFENTDHNIFLKNWMVG